MRHSRFLMIFALLLASLNIALTPAIAQSSKKKAPRKSETPVAPLPDPPIPVEHIRNAGIERCAGVVNTMSRQTLTGPYNAQSGWNAPDPQNHIFQSVAGLNSSRNSPPDGLAALIAAPVGEQGCDGVALQVYPLAGTCASVQKVLANGGQIAARLMNVQTVFDAKKNRLFLLPGFANTCIAVSVNSYFGDTAPAQAAPEISPNPLLDLKR